MKKEIVRFVRFVAGVGALGNTIIAFLVWHTSGQEMIAWVWLLLGMVAVLLCLSYERVTP